MAVDIQDMQQSHFTALSTLYVQSARDYSQYFTPFSVDASTLDRLLQSKRRDRYYVIFSDEQVAGFYMLRGLDEGYTAPMYGVWIAEAYSGRGLALHTLHHAVSVCAELRCHDLLLKVHPQNLRAKRMYERFGFSEIASDPKNGNVIYRLSL